MRSRILIVEDESIVARDIQKMLLGLNYAVVNIVSSGEAAIQAALDLRPDLVLMDIGLKGDIDGIETATRIRAHGDVPVIYLTAYSNATILERAKITEPFGYILKPFEERDLHITIEMALHKHSLEKKLKQHERLLDAMLQTMVDGMVMVAPSGEINYANRAAASILEQSIAEILGKYYDSLEWGQIQESGEPLAKEQMPLSIALHAQREVRGWEHGITCRDGRVKWVSINAAPLYDDAGQLSGAIASFRDVTERKQAQDDLRRAHEQLEKRVEERTADLSRTNQLLTQEISERVRAEVALKETLARVEQVKQEWEATVDALPQLVCLVDQRGRLLRANRQCEIWGLGEINQVAGKNVHTFLHQHCNDPQCYFPAFWEQSQDELIRGDKTTFEGYDPLIQRYLFLQLCPILTESDCVEEESGSFAVLVIDDLSERKKAEQALQESEKRYRQQAAELEVLYETGREQYRRLQLSQMRLIQSEKMAALGRLTASISHEINNPLQSVQYSLSLMEEEMSGARRVEKIRRYLSIASSEIERISTITRRMREFYRPIFKDGDAGKQPPDGIDKIYYGDQPLAVDIHTIIESVTALTEQQMREVNIEVVCQFDRSLPPIFGSPDQLKQVFLNLVLNAMDALPAQGGVLRFVTMPGQMITHQTSSPAVRIEVQDNGHGIAPEVVSRIFEPFFTTKSQGTGLGLSICFEIIEAHSGQISVISKVNEGTTFIILLPLTRPLGQTRKEDGRGIPSFDSNRR